MKVSWILRYTRNILYGRKLSGRSQEMNSCVKLESNSMICGSTGPLKHKRSEVSWSCPDHWRFNHSTSANFKVEFNPPIQGLHWLAIVVRYLDCCHNDSLSKSICRFATSTWMLRMYESRLRWWNWTGSGLFWVVSILEAMLVGWW